MVVTPPAAKIENDDDLMEIDPQAPRNGEEADVESEGGNVRRRSRTPKETKPTIETANPKSKTPIEIPDDNEDEEDDEDDDDGDEETFAVEKVLNHRIAKKGNGQKGFQYYIKWLGYDKESDNTWEDEENCEGSKSLVDAYWERLGGKPNISATQKQASRKRTLSTPASDSGSSKRQRRQTQTRDASPAVKSPEISLWHPPADLENWDDKVAEVETVERADNGLVLVYLLWKNGRRSCHDTTVVYQKCPQQMLKFYESHLVFKEEDVKEVKPLVPSTPQNGVKVE